MNRTTFNNMISRGARPAGRARIETSYPVYPTRTATEAPGLRVGRGLKLAGSAWAALQTARGARPAGRARIEPRARRRAAAGQTRGARPAGRARIETHPPARARLKS